MRKFTLFFAFLGVMALNSAQAQVTIIVQSECGGGSNRFLMCWNLTSDSVLTIWGKGDMMGHPNLLSWTSPAYESLIKKAVIGNHGDSIDNIGNNAFATCPNITSVIVRNAYPPVFKGNNVFSSWQFANIPLYVPCGQLNAYRTHADWGNFTNIFEITGYGTCGAFGGNLTWKLECDSTLTISGSGDMEDYFYAVQRPWDAVVGKVKTVIIGNNVTSIGDNAFEGCINLTSVTIGNGVTSIGRNAFDLCTNLPFVNIGSNVTSIGDFAFRACYDLASVGIGSSVISIGDAAFFDCGSLHSIIIPNSVKTIGNRAFAECEKLVMLTIGNNVTSIGQGAFFYCSNLTSITIPDSVKTIGYEAFENCSNATSLTIGSGVTNMGDRVFYRCSKLTGITVHALIPPVVSGNLAFYFVPTSIPVNVHCSVIPDYKAAAGWRNFVNYPGEISAPYDIAVVAQDSIFEISWEDTTSTRYEVYRNDVSLGIVDTNAYTDYIFNSGTYCYMVRAIDGDCVSEFSDTACQTYEKPISIAEIAQSAGFKVYPNPVSTQLKITNYELRENTEYSIYSVVGQVVMSCRDVARNVPTIDVSHLASGMYFLKIDGKMMKIVKE